ncbi:MAG: acetyl-CoA carboxylase biotin carboxylase subunit [Myxococcales bacterium]|nr:acetyl-CoA carboxylase biotin carboxylase subunit [Myxococcales bacterium]
MADHAPASSSAAVCCGFGVPVIPRPKVLVANRGEIACRVLRACRELGLPTVAVYSDPDARARHVWLADEAVRVGPAPSADSYLRGDRILAAMRQTGATLVHPGYGFLSENADFRDACDDAGMTFVGPPAAAMRAMGVKTSARAAMRAAGVPVVPGSDGPVATIAEALHVCETIGWPVMLKAASGGGGKGIRVVRAADELQAAFEGVQREATAYFKDATVYLEKCIERPRHVEIQVLADRHGHTIHLFERECSVQRRNQKIIEESPAANLSEATRQAMGAMAVKAAAAVGYESAGTIECLVDAGENFWFLEMNTRLQVEHPVTELATGIDLVVEQLCIAQGAPLSVRQEDVQQRGHAIECRIYAEDPARGFLPSPGPLVVYRPPVGPGLRLDDGFGEGDEVPRFYDPMIAKLSAWAPDRPRCIGRMQAALAAFEIAGIAHNIDHLLQVLASAAFQAGRYDTGLVGTLPPLPTTAEADPWVLAWAAIAEHRASRGRSATPPTSAESAWALQARQGGLRSR